MDNLKRGPVNFNRNFPIRKPIQRTIAPNVSQKFPMRKPLATRPFAGINPRKPPFQDYSPISRFSPDKSPKKQPSQLLMIGMGVLIFFIILIIILVILGNRNKGSQTDVVSQDLDMIIKNVQLENNSIKVNMSINPKDSKLVGIKFIFEAEGKFEVFKEDFLSSASGINEFTFKLKNLNSKEITKVLVSPIFEDNEKGTFVGSIKDTYVPELNDNSGDYSDYQDNSNNYYQNYSDYEEDYYNDYNYNKTNNVSQIKINNTNQTLNNNTNASQLNYTNQTNNQNNSQTNYTNTTYSTPVCGNGKLEIGEFCEINNLAGESCISLGFVSGTLGCRKTCEFDTRYCSDSTINNSVCTTHASYFCYNNDVYWYNSCDERETIKQDCNSTQYCANNVCVNNQTTSSCNSNSYSACYNGDVYWYNNCGIRESIRYNCGSTQTCSNGACVDSCVSHSSSSCYNNNIYWYNSCGTRESIRYSCNSTQTCTNGVCVSNVTSSKTFPLKISSNSRYLTYQDGTPFLMVGDTAWSMIAQLNKTDADYYLQSRSQKGFNTILINLIEGKYADNAPSNIYGVAPFTGKTFTTPNEAYFAHADYIINSARQKGMIVLLAPIYADTDEGFGYEIQSASESDMLAWGRYVGQRYQNYDNIIWDIGGDIDPTFAKTKIQKVAEGIKEYNPNALFTAHNIRGQMAVDPWSGASWLNLNDIYSYKTEIPEDAKRAYDLSSIKPFFLFEGIYENEHTITTPELRSQAYWTMLSGGFGNMFGNCPMWSFDTTTAISYCGSGLKWKNQLNSAGAESMIYEKKLFESINWNLLIPDFNHLILKSGYGTLGEADYAIGAKTSDNSAIVIYLPTQRTISVDTTVLSGTSIKSQWYNPREGNYVDLGTSSESSSNSYTTPTTSGPDWVLVITSSTVCTSQYSSACYNGDVYWYNSCGNREGIRYDCSTSQTCSSGQCVNTGNCGIAEGTYTGVTINIGADFTRAPNTNPAGTVVYNNRIYVNDWNVSDSVYEYYMNGTFTGFKFHLFSDSASSNGCSSSGNGCAQGMYYDGSNFYVSNWYWHAGIYRYSANGQYLGVFINTSLNGADDLEGVYFDGAYYYVVDYLDQEIYIYNINGGYTGRHWDTGVSGNICPSDIISDGTYFWILDHCELPNLRGYIYKYFVNGTYTGNHFYLSGLGNGNAEGLGQNSTHFFVTDEDQRKIYLYYKQTSPCS
jgi:hypothetical protein